MENTPNTNTKAHKFSKGFLIVVLVIIALSSLGVHSYVGFILSIIGIVFAIDKLYLKVRPNATAGSGIGTAFLLFFIATIFMIVALVRYDGLEKEKREKAKYEALTPAQKEQIEHEKELKKKEQAVQDKIKKSFSSYDGSHRGLVKFVKANMNDPKSFEHVKTTYTVQPTGYLIVKMEYRGKNAFGGVVKNTIGAECDLDGNVTQVLQTN